MILFVAIVEFCVISSASYDGFNGGNWALVRRAAGNTTWHMATFDFLFGLDNLKRHQCNIDLVHNMLHMRNGEISVPFLSEAEIKKN